MATFDPRLHLRTLTRKAKDKSGVWVDINNEYLDCRWRVMWVRTEHPDASIVTELMEHTEGYALFRATVTLASGAGATGWGSETRADFNDYLEKAETKALGRALAHLGFGTAFAIEMDEGGSVADAPVDRKSPAPPAPATARELSGQPDRPRQQPAATPTSAGDERRRLNAALLAAMAAHNTQQSQVTTAIRDLYGAVRTGDLTDQQVIDVTGWIEDRLELRYTASGAAVLVPIAPTDVGTLAIETVAFDGAVTV